MSITPVEAPHAKDGKVRVTYQDIHKTIGNASIRIKAEFDPDIMVAIGGGGFFPARVLRTFLKTKGRNIPIQAIGLSLYEQLGAPGGGDFIPDEEVMGTEVVRTQWLDISTLGETPLIGRRILIVDEVDDSRTTLSYAAKELLKDIEKHLNDIPEEKRGSYPKTQLAIFAVHNKLKEKAAEIPEGVKYFAGMDIQNIWVVYPWEQVDIDDHDRIAAEQKELGLGLKYE